MGGRWHSVVGRRLEIGQHVLQRMLEHCWEDRPCEACGILTGRGGRVLHGYAAENSRRSPVYYEVDPAQQAVVLAEMDGRGDELIAIYHSHPTSPAKPSGNDIRLAVNWPDALRVIISLANGRTETRAFLIRNGRSHDIPLVITHDGVGEWHDLRGSGEHTHKG